MKRAAVILFCIWSSSLSAAADEPVLPSTPTLKTPVHSPTLPDVRFTFSEGKVVLKMGGVEGPPITGDMPLIDGDEIKTSSASYAEVFFSGGSLVRLGPESRLRIKRLAPGQVVLLLNKGVLLAKVQFEKGEGQRFVVLTPAVAASVRGTEFVLEHLNDRTYAGVLDEGHLALKASGFRKEVVMRFNQETSVQRGTPPRDPKVIAKMYPYKTQMAEMRSRLKELRKSVGPLTPEQCHMMRAGWINTHKPVPPPPPAPLPASKKSQSR